MSRILRMAGVAAAAIALAGCSAGLAEDERLSFSQPPATGTVNAPLQPFAAPATPAPSQGAWSGESGASGHPDMTADAIRAAAANFKSCLENLWPHAARRGVSRALYARYAMTLAPELKIMDLLDAQPEFTKSLWDYLDLLVSEERIAEGREILKARKATFDAVERTYGVDRHVVAAIWGVESKFGAMIGERDVLRSTATLACIGRRQKFFRDEFLAALEILQRGDLRPEQLKGSWAGAFGPTQFMPTSFQRYAVDFDGDGRRDVVGSLADVLASTANNLKKDGWASGQTWGYEVALPRGFDYALADPARRLTIRQWQQRGVARANGQPFPRAGDRAFLLLPAGAQGPAFLMLHNFRVIMRYNPAEAYALAIGHLADRLRGGAPLVQPWPRHERVLTRAERYELQQQLARRGYPVGEPDGRIGPRTRAAIRDFQAASGEVPDGFASATLLERLRAN